MAGKNVLLIVVDQWRGDFLPHLMRAEGREPFLKTPNLDRLCREGVTWRLKHADRTLTHFRSSPSGLDTRNP